MLNLISGTDFLNSGEIHLNGHSLTGLSENDRMLFRRENIGFIFQFFNLIPTLKVIENVTLPLELTCVALEEARKTATKFLAAVGLDDREGAVTVTGTYQGEEIHGVGFVEMTGYASSMEGEF